MVSSLRLLHLSCHEHESKRAALRGKYLADVDWSEAVPYFSHSFGVSLAVVTSDGYTVFTQRGKTVGTRPKVYDMKSVQVVYNGGMAKRVEVKTDLTAEELQKRYRQTTDAVE